MKQSADTRTILKLLAETGPLSRRDLAARCGMSLSKATNLVLTLEGAGFVETEQGSSSGGRIPQLTRLKPDLFFSAGFDIGTEYVRAALVDLGGAIKASLSWRHDIETPRNLPLSRLVGHLEELCDRADINPRRVESLGVGVTGIVHEKSGLCLSLRNTPLWKGLNVVGGLREATGVDKVMIMDSVRAMAVAEMLYGAGRSIDDFVLINIGIGLGAGIVLNGRLISGDRGTSGEFGHMHIRPSSELCVCGNYGCLEAIASGWAILRKCRNAIRHGVETGVGGGESTDISTADIIDAADRGDKFAMSILENMAKDLSVGIGSVINILNPEKIILSGGIIRHAEAHMLEPLTRGVKATVIPWLQQGIRLEVSSLGEWDTALGAAARAASNRIAAL